MTLPFGSDSDCIQGIVERQAASSPARVALSYGAARLTYRELNERSNQVAHLLRKRGVGPDVFVGLCLERSIELIVALLGILKAGGAYVPIDPHYPRERRTFMLEDCKARLILTQRSLAEDVSVAGGELIVMDRDADLIAREPTTNLEPKSSAEHLAYVIYTSGSTGTPKGTMISHRNVVRLFSSTQPWFNFSAADTWTLFHSCAFDFSVWEIWGALFHGGALVIVPFDVSRTPESFRRLLRDEKVSVLNQTPSAFRQLMRTRDNGEDGDLSLRLVIFGGEALDFASLQPWFERHGDQRPRLVNMYGITETTVHTTYHPITAQEVESGSGSNIGVPLPDLQVYVVDEAGVPVQPGEVGEIYVGGAGVARGYLNRPELTAQRFVTDPNASDPQRRFYRSGDLGRYLANGDLEYLGRIDSQVKIRGFRIEPGEIAAAIEAHPAIRESVVLVRESAAGDKILVAYVVARPGQETSPAALRQALRERLPDFMVPAAFHFIDAIPLTVNGKLDVQALAAVQSSETPRAEPLIGTDLERGIAGIWRDVLEAPTVELDQNFFDVGGNSGNLAVVHERLQEWLARRFSPTDLYAHPTVRSLAAHFAQSSPSSPTVDPIALRAQRQRDAFAAQRQLHRERK